MRKILSLLMALLLVCSIPLSALAIEVDVTYGDVTIGDTTVKHTTAENETKEDAHEGSVVVTGSTGWHTITVNVNTEVNVTLDNVTVNNTAKEDGADWYHGGSGMTVTTGESGKVTVELEGENTLKGSEYAAGILTSNNLGELEITDVDNDGSLVATAGGVGIGGCDGEDGTNILISGGTITASGTSGPGIGGGNCSNITIDGGTITATGGECSAGIGVGWGSVASNIVINGGVVNATGGDYAAGIGGGSEGSLNGMVINGGEITAVGGYAGAGIGGGGGCGFGSNITINDGVVSAVGGDYAAGIGGGQDGSGDNITICGGEVTATGGGGGAGIGGGNWYSGSNIVIAGGTVTATGGECATGIGGGHDGSGSNIVIEGTVDADIVGSGVTVTAGNAVVTAKGDGEADDIGSCPKTAQPEPPEPTDPEPTEPEPTDPKPNDGVGEPTAAQPQQDSYIIYTVDTIWEEEWDLDAKMLIITALDPETNEVIEDAIFTTWGFGIDALMYHYKIDTVRFITANCQRDLDLSELAKLVTATGDEYDLIHRGTENTLMLNNVNVEAQLLEQKSAGK